MLFAIADDTVPASRDMRWRAEAADLLGRVDLYSVFRDPKLDDRAAYALTHIESPEARTVRLAVESDDDVVILLNGRRVHRREVKRELRSGGDTMFITLLRSPKWPDAHADIGMQHVTLSVVPHAGDWRTAVIREAAAELNSPMMAVALPSHAGRRQGTDWLSSEPATIDVGALKRAEDDDRVIVRLVETSGRATIAHLRLASPVVAREGDLLERELPAGFHARGAQLDVPMGAFEIKTIVMRPP